MAVGILAILGVIVMPTFSALMQTYRLNAATLELASNLRYAQSLAVSNGASYRLHWGNDRAPKQPNTYRVEKSPWPAEADTMISNANVITSWTDIGTSYPGMTLTTVKDNNNVTLIGVIFSSKGSSEPSTTFFPITLSINSADGTTKTIQVRRTGNVKVL